MPISILLRNLSLEVVITSKVYDGRSTILSVESECDMKTFVHSTCYFCFSYRQVSMVYLQSHTMNVQLGT